MIYRFAQELRDLGYPVLPIRKIKFGGAIKTFGTCKRHYRGGKPTDVTLTINEVCWHAADYSVKATILHELIHAMTDTTHHDARFKQYAAELSKRYGVPIGTHADNEEWTAVKTDREIVFPYKVICRFCGVSTNYLRRAKIIRDIENGHGDKYVCRKCGGRDFEVEYMRVP